MLPGSDLSPSLFLFYATNYSLFLSIIGHFCSKDALDKCVVAEWNISPLFIQITFQHSLISDFFMICLDAIPFSLPSSLLESTIIQISPWNTKGEIMLSLLV